MDVHFAFGAATVLLHRECFYGRFPFLHWPLFCNCLGEAMSNFSPFSLLLRFTFQTSFCEIKKESWNRIVYAYNSQSTFISVSISHFTIREIVISPDFKVTAYSGGIRLLPLQMATTQQTGVADCHQSGTKLNYCLAAWFGRCYSCVGEKQL